MDALCIDQSTTQEKNHQVGMMGQIYARSVHVMACVGPHDVLSRSLFRFMKKNRSLLARIHRLTLDCPVAATTWVIPNSIPDSAWVTLWCSVAINRHQREELAIVFRAFMQRSYFSRVWILQELYLAPRISLCCGMDTSLFEHLQSVSMLVDFWTTFYVSYYRPNKKVHVLGTLSKHIQESRQIYSDPYFRRSLMCIQPQLGCLSLASGIMVRRPLAALLEALQAFQCSDVRDRLFGVLALVRWGNTEPPAPDYGKSNYEIAIEVLRLCLYDFETQLILGVAFEWPRLLWKVFDVLVEVNVLWEALSKTYGSPKIPDIWLQVNLAFHRGSDGYRSGKLSRKIQANQNSLEEFPSATPPRPLGFKGHTGDTWYGTRLLAFDDQNLPHSRNPVPHYLCCCEDDSNDSASSSDSMALNAWIMDQYQRPFAHVVYTDIRPNDWLLISEADYCRGNDEEMLVVRVTDGVSGLYRILGRALAEDQHRVILRSLCWEYFGSSWNVEDLFFWDWAYNSDPSGDLKQSDWVARVILTRGDSPSFYGPTTHTQDDDIEQQT
jgi:hypothetical protein